MRLIFSGLLALLFFQAFAQSPVYKDSSQSIDNGVKDLLSKMTVEEKAGQLNQLNAGFFTGPATSNQGQKNTGSRRDGSGLSIKIMFR